MRTVSLKEAERNLAAIIQEMRQRDESIEIVDAERANMPVALLTPHHKTANGANGVKSRAQGLAMIRRLRAEVSGKMTSKDIRDAIDEGRP